MNNRQGSFTSRHKPSGPGRFYLLIYGVNHNKLPFHMSDGVVVAEAQRFNGPN